MINSLINLMSFVDIYTKYLGSLGCCFNDMGFPIMEESQYLSDWPETVVPYNGRKSRFVTDRRHTVICHFCSDSRIYPRLAGLLDELSEYQEFMGVVGFDLSVTYDMDVEWQREVMLVNQLATAVLAFNGVKVVNNLRCGCLETLDCFQAVPRGVMCSSSTLGCMRTSTVLDLEYPQKILSVLPSKVLIYGKDDPIMTNQLDLLGVPFRRYSDLHTMYKSRKGTNFGN